MRGPGVCRLGWEGGAWLQRTVPTARRPDGGVLPPPFALRDLGLRRIKCHTLDILAPHLLVLDPTWTVDMPPSLNPLENALGKDQMTRGQIGGLRPRLLTENLLRYEAHRRVCVTLRTVSELCQCRRPSRTPGFTEGPARDLKWCGTAWGFFCVMTLLSTKALPGPVGSHVCLGGPQPRCPTLLEHVTVTVTIPQRPLCQLLGGTPVSISVVSAPCTLPATQQVLTKCTGTEG